MTKGGNCTGECIEQMKQKMKFDIEARVCVLVTNADFLLSLQGDHVIQPLDKCIFAQNPYLALSCFKHQKNARCADDHYLLS